MAKKRQHKGEPQVARMAARSSAPQDKLTDFAEDLGRLLGQAQNKAEGWLGQRQAIAEQLVGVRDTANRLLEQLGVGGTTGSRRRPGRPRKSGAGEFAPAPLSKKQRRKKRTMSAEARERIAAAQRARWAKQKKNQS
jgi:hypothetical protein